MPETSNVPIVNPFASFFRTSLLTLFALLLFTNCEKEARLFPQIELLGSVAREQAYQDTLYLEFRLQDYDRYQVSLMDGAQATALKHRVIFSENGQYELEVIWQDPYLESGSYQIRIQAFNGDEGTSEFIQISYTTLALSVEGYAVLEDQDLKIIQNGQSLTYPLSRNFDRVFANARDSVYYLCAKTGLVEVRSWQDFSLLNTIGNGQRNYQSFALGQRGIYLLGVDGLIQKVEGQNVVGTYQLTSNLSFVPLSATEIDGQLAIAFARQQGNGGELIVMNRAFNAEVQNYYPMVGANPMVCALGADQLAVAQEVSAGVSVYLYDLNQQTFTLQFTLTETQLFALGAVGDDGLVFCTEGGSHYFNTSTFRITQFLDNYRYGPGESAQVLDQYFWVDTTGWVRAVYYDGSAALAGNAGLGNNAIDLAILYNK